MSTVLELLRKMERYAQRTIFFFFAFWLKYFTTLYLYFTSELTDEWLYFNVFNDMLWNVILHLFSASSGQSKCWW